MGTCDKCGRFFWDLERHLEQHEDDEPRTMRRALHDDPVRTVEVEGSIAGRRLA